MDDYGFTTGSDKNLCHRRRIGTGSFADVHEVPFLRIGSRPALRLYPNRTGVILYGGIAHIEKAFARKLVRLTTEIRRDIKNEVRAITKLFGEETHKNIVSILKFGEFTNSPYYFIDMELCDATLEDYIYVKLLCSAIRPDSVSYPWEVIGDIASGLEFIHSRNLVHRN